MSTINPVRLFGHWLRLTSSLRSTLNPEREREREREAWTPLELCLSLSAAEVLQQGLCERTHAGASAAIHCMSSPRNVLLQCLRQVHCGACWSLTLLSAMSKLQCCFLFVYAVRSRHGSVLHFSCLFTQIAGFSYCFPVPHQSSSLSGLRCC